jgi:hypothetical protein
MAVSDHHQVALKSSDVEVEVTRLNDERYVDVRSNHLELYVPACGFAPQEGSAWQQLVNAGLCAGIAVVNTHPIAHAWKLSGGLGKVKKFASQFGWYLAVLAPDQISPSVNRGDSGYRQIGSTQFAGFAFQPAIQTKFAEFHEDIFTDSGQPANLLRECEDGLISLGNNRLNSSPFPGTQFDEINATLPTFQGITERLVSSDQIQYAYFSKGS